MFNVLKLGDDWSSLESECVTSCRKFRSALDNFGKFKVIIENETKWLNEIQKKIGEKKVILFIVGRYHFSVFFQLFPRNCRVFRCVSWDGRLGRVDGGTRRVANDLARARKWHNSRRVERDLWSVHARWDHGRRRSIAAENVHRQVRFVYRKGRGMRKKVERFMFTFFQTRSSLEICPKSHREPRRKHSTRPKTRHRHTGNDVMALGSDDAPAGASGRWHLGGRSSGRVWAGARRVCAARGCHGVVEGNMWGLPEGRKVGSCGEVRTTDGCPQGVEKISISTFTIAFPVQ